MDEAAYRTLLGQLEKVDPADFEASLPPNIVTPTEQDATIAEMLSDITVPDGFDPKSIKVDGYNERYHVGAPVTGKVTCSWIQAYADAQAAGDQAGVAEAAAAMDGSRDWDVLREMADQGGWSEEVWEHGRSDGGRTAGPPGGPELRLRSGGLATCCTGGRRPPSAPASTLVGMRIPAAPVIEGATHIHSGKVRDLYALGDGNLLMVASDRISAYDFILEPGIPDKGEILTRMSLWWFDRLDVDNHVVSTDVPALVAGRAVICERLDMFPVECVARGYLTGSGLLDYRATGEVCGVALPPGLEDGSQLPEPIFTPATKAELGEHDENVSYDAVVDTVGPADARALRELTIDVYTRAEAIAREQGIILADTKFEFGRRPGLDKLDQRAIVLADEVLTPDSSRFWPADQWQPGRSQPSYDKQIVRDWLTSAESGWDRSSGEPPPDLPSHVVDLTRRKYVEAFERLTGTTF